MNYKLDWQTASGISCLLEKKQEKLKTQSVDLILLQHMPKFTTTCYRHKSYSSRDPKLVQHTNCI